MEIITSLSINNEKYLFLIQGNKVQRRKKDKEFMKQKSDYNLQVELNDAQIPA